MTSMEPVVVHTARLIWVEADGYGTFSVTVKINLTCIAWHSASCMSVPVEPPSRKC